MRIGTQNAGTANMTTMAGSETSQAILTIEFLPLISAWI
jgi:hypothetical protein